MGNLRDGYVIDFFEGPVGVITQEGEHASIGIKIYRTDMNSGGIGHLREVSCIGMNEGSVAEEKSATLERVAEAVNKEIDRLEAYEKEEDKRYRGQGK